MRAIFLIGAAFLNSCGYHVAGTADTIPKTVRTIAVPPFSNATTRYKLTDSLPNQIARELISRTRYETVHDAGAADAVLQGTVVRVDAFPTIFDPVTSRAAGVEVLVTLSVQLRERATGNLLYNQPSFVYRQRYEISTDPAVYFDESSTAFQRLSREVARAVVSALLENF